MMKIASARSHIAKFGRMSRIGCPVPSIGETHRLAAVGELHLLRSERVDELLQAGQRAVADAGPPRDLLQAEKYAAAITAVILMKN